MKMTLKSQVEKVKKVSRTDNRHSFWRGMSPFRICQRVGATTLMCDKRAHNKMHELGKANQKELKEEEKVEERKLLVCIQIRAVEFVALLSNCFDCAQKNSTSFARTALISAPPANSAELS